MTITKMPEFLLERYYGRWEFTTPHNLSPSDCETMTIGELLALTGEPISALTDLSLGYTRCEGEPALRETIARLYERIEPDDVLVTNAPQEAILLAMTSLLSRGERVIVQTPCYQSLGEIARSRGCEVVDWPLIETETGWRLDLEALESLLTPGTRLLVINAPHNPTGFQPSLAEFDAVIEIARRHGTWLFSDEMYRGLERTPAARLPAAADRYERAISLWGTSKTFGLPGLRIGWLALSDRDLYHRLLEQKDWTTICSSAPSEVLARIALEHAETLMTRSRAIVETNLGHLEALCRRHEDVFAWRTPMAGPVVFPRLVRGSATAFCDTLRETGGVLLVPSPMFQFGDEHVRFGLGRRPFPTDLAALEMTLGRMASLAGSSGEG